MEYDVIGMEETPEQLSARLGLPVCMLLRANRLCSTAWLLPGRRIAVPEKAFCRKDAGPCPVQLLALPAERFDPSADPAGLPARLRLWSRTHGGAGLREWGSPGRTLTVLAGENTQAVAVRAGITESELRRLNRFYGRCIPGMTFWAPFQS